MSFGVGHRCSLDPVLLWLWRRPAATALIGPLAWDPPYAEGVALKRQQPQNIKSTVLTVKWQSWDMNPGHGSIEAALQPLHHAVPCKDPPPPAQIRVSSQKL